MLVAVFVQSVLWAAWLVWLAHLPDRRPLSRRAFGLVVAPGAAMAFVLFAVPFAWGLASADVAPDRATLPAFVPIAAGVALFAAGVGTLGLRRIAFAQEFAGRRFVLETRGIYGRLRHPCFAGAVLASAGVGAALGPVALAAAAVNLAVVPLYVRLEDRRLVRAHGSTYDEYRRRVPAVLPRSFRARSQRRVALTQHVAPVGRDG